VRLLLPRDGALEVPTWAANNFVYADGARPTLRTLTPVDADPARGRLSLEIVRHGDGAATAWAATARAGDPTAISGPARGYVPPASAAGFLFGGDETAIPALAQLAAAVPAGIATDVLVEIGDHTARLPLTDRPEITVQWIDGDEIPGAALATAFEARRIAERVHVWAGGEAAAMQRIRRHLYDTLGLERERATARGYWKHGRSAGSDG
jgi:NADPH-dependent ferric siderophore reductase